MGCSVSNSNFGATESSMWIRLVLNASQSARLRIQNDRLEPGGMRHRADEDTVPDTDRPSEDLVYQVVLGGGLALCMYNVFSFQNVICIDNTCISCGYHSSRVVFVALQQIFGCVCDEETSTTSC